MNIKLNKSFGLITIIAGFLFIFYYILIIYLISWQHPTFEKEIEYCEFVFYTAKLILFYFITNYFIKLFFISTKYDTIIKFLYNALLVCIGICIAITIYTISSSNYEILDKRTLLIKIYLCYLGYLFFGIAYLFKNNKIILDYLIILLSLIPISFIHLNLYLAFIAEIILLLVIGFKIYFTLKYKKTAHNSA